MDNKKLEDVAPTAEMQLGEDKIKQLVVDADLGGRSDVGIHGKLIVPSPSIITFSYIF